MADSKTTLPWLAQDPGWGLFAAITPWGARSFKNTKPQMFREMFGTGDLENVDALLDPYRRFTREYQPFDYLAGNTIGRPGGPSAAEQGVLNNSLFGTTARLNLGGADAAAANQAAFTNFLSPTGGGGFGTAPAGGLPFDWSQAAGRSYIPGKGWQEVGFGQNPDVVEYAPTGQVYYRGKEITPAQLSQLYASNPAGVGAAGGYGQMTNDIFTSLGGQLPIPTAPTAPTIPGAPALPAFNLPAFNLPAAPSLPAYQVPNVGQLAANTWQQFSGMVPGFSGSLERALNPEIAMPGQSIFDMVAAQRAQGGPMDAYVNAATDATQAAADRRLQKQSTDLMSRFAQEGSYLSGPMLNALGELSASSNADVANIMGQLRLNAAEGESNRLFQGATTQYNNELQRNITQAQIGAATAQQLADVFGQIAATTGSAEAAASADAYRAQASFLSSIYGSQTGALASAYGSGVGALASAYGTNADYLANTYGTNVRGLTDIYGTQAGLYGTGLNAALQQQQFVTQAATQRAVDLANMYGMSFDQAMRMAEAEQKNQQSALDALRQNFYQPGANLLQAMQPFFGLPSVTTPTGGGFGDLLGSTLQAAGGI